MKFDHFMPIYNWLYPISYTKDNENAFSNNLDIFNKIPVSSVTKRAIYIHIPFCDTICSFCPFVRTTFTNEDLIENYVRALIQEIKIKSRYDTVTNIPIGAIFIGGGTPSILNRNQILEIGKTLKENFNLSQIDEFSCEMEVKSITKEKNEAFKEIGVTHARFGLQTFNKKYRDLFTLTSSLNQIYNAVQSLNDTFSYVSFDMLYGMNGQTEKEFIEDL
ncbi:MAG TPA: radical SAM protein, partial [Aquella sp.]|nr:radical SAM protein [Aquella sp.]